MYSDRERERGREGERERERTRDREKITQPLFDICKFIVHLVVTQFDED